MRSRRCWRQKGGVLFPCCCLCYFAAMDALLSLVCHDEGKAMQLPWNSGAFDEMGLVLEKAEADEAVASQFAQLEEQTLEEACQGCASGGLVAAEAGAVLTAESFQALSSEDKETAIKLLGAAGLANIEVEYDAATVHMRFSPQIQQVLACTVLEVLNRLEKLDGVLNAIAPDWTLELQVPLGGKKGLFQWEMLIMRIYPWVSVREVSYNALSANRAVAHDVSASDVPAGASPAKRAPAARQGNPKGRSGQSVLGKVRNLLIAILLAPVLLSILGLIGLVFEAAMPGLDDDSLFILSALTFFVVMGVVVGLAKWVIRARSSRVGKARKQGSGGESKAQFAAGFIGIGVFLALVMEFSVQFLLVLAILAAVGVAAALIKSRMDKNGGKENEDDGKTAVGSTPDVKLEPVEKPAPAPELEPELESTDAPAKPKTHDQIVAELAARELANSKDPRAHRRTINHSLYTWNDIVWLAVVEPRPEWQAARVGFNRLSGVPVKWTGRQRSYGFVLGSEDDWETLTYEKLARESGKKIDANNWQEFIPDDQERPSLFPERQIWRVPAEDCLPTDERTPDAFYVFTVQRFGSRVIYFRKLDDGYHAFHARSTDPSLPWAIPFFDAIPSEGLIDIVLSGAPRSYEAFDSRVDETGVNWFYRQFNTRRESDEEEWNDLYGSAQVTSIEVTGGNEKKSHRSTNFSSRMENIVRHLAEETIEVTPSESTRASASSD